MCQQSLLSISDIAIGIHLRALQCASRACRQELSRNSIVCSMSHRGGRWGHALVERFFRDLKNERTSCKIYYVCDKAKQDIIDCIEMFYNNQRLRSCLGYISPSQYEEQAL